ncbi:uncharacterized protein MCYG_01820 [Microsporum canis CBS 113480]|uniref:Uncharacterized protein n=1 Tax=Arthroderma otae (strain ATCC MYA-4605 / CBS 113480) TaxID=554155 RepID=C5FI21_ARTOC|nr:uncharacterized protein MCYG_01820 [Microsporum canis CBS 113480]EEQ29001.1 hypothetical protein MCYG_01820 [Microsporum canis CBS 113480]
MSRKDLLRFLSKPAKLLYTIQQTSSSARPDTFNGIGICQFEGHRQLITIPALKAFYLPISTRPP